jgi:hypothetical protein
MAIVNSVIVPGLRDHRVIPEFGHGEGYRFIERFGLNMGCMSGGISVDEGDAATGEHLGIINRLSPSIRSQKSASTIRSTNLLFLYVLQVLRQSFHTVEVTGSNPVAPTIESITYRPS